MVARLTHSDVPPDGASSAVPQELVLALLSVDGATAACASHGDMAAVAVLGSCYAVVADAIAGADGEVVKVMGDGLLVSFPIARASEAVAALRVGQARATRQWRSFDPRCSVMVRATAGQVLQVSLGPPGSARPELYGDVLNQLFKRAAGDFILSPQLAALLP